MGTAGPARTAPARPAVIACTGKVLQRPAGLIWLLIAGQIVTWTLAPALTHVVPPLDVVEGYMWGQERVIATYKHPALPSWVLEMTRLLTGTVGWPAYLASQLFVGASFFFVYRLGCDLMGRERAAAGTLLLTGILYYSWTTPEFNHNIVQTTFWAGFAWALWRAVDRQALLWWVILAAFASLAFYAKLSTALLLVAGGIWMLLDARGRAAFATYGPFLALALLAVAVAPLGSWLAETNFAMLRYAAERTSYATPKGIHEFVLGALGALAGFLPLLAAGLVRRPAAGGGGAGTLPAVDPRALRFLLVLTGVPPALLIVAALVTGTGLKAAWASSMFNLTGLLAIAMSGARFHPRSLQRIAAVALGLVVAIPVAYAVFVSMPFRTGKPPLRVLWSGPEISARMSAVWDQATGGAPLRIVAGENWVAGLIALPLGDRPHLLSDVNLARSPWISARQLEDQGMLVVWEERKAPIDMQPYINARTEEWRFEKFTAPSSRIPIEIGYIVVPPRRVAR